MGRAARGLMKRRRSTTSRVYCCISSIVHLLGLLYCFSTFLSTKKRPEGVLSCLPVLIHLFLYRPGQVDILELSSGPGNLQHLIKKNNITAAAHQTSGQLMQLIQVVP